MDFTLFFMYFITVNKYRFCISVIGYINMQIIGIGYKKNQYWSITSYEEAEFGSLLSQGEHHLFPDLRKGWIQNEACVIPGYLGMQVPWQTQKQMNWTDSPYRSSKSPGRPVRWSAASACGVSVGTPLLLRWPAPETLQ